MAFLTKGIRIVLGMTEKRSPYRRSSLRGRHQRSLISYLNRGKTPLYPEIVYCEGNRDGVSVEVALQHNDGYNEGVYSFVNNITTPEGGTHLTGFRNALTKTFNTYAKQIS